jgi:hypothetical protein
MDLMDLSAKSTGGEEVLLVKNRGNSELRCVNAARTMIFEAFFR